jgi:hypothetical protein
MKQNLKITIILGFAIFCFMQCKSQSYVEKYMPEYIDKYITDKIIDSLEISSISNNYIIFQTNIDNRVVIDTSLTQNDTIAVSYLLWKDNGKIKSFIIMDNYVYISNLSIEDDTKLFSYPYYSYLWIRKDEDVYQVVPHITSPSDKSIVVYVTPSYKRFFEYGRNAYYKLKPSRNKYRQEYISLLKSVVSQFDYKWEKAFKNEKRWWGEDNFE